MSNQAELQKQITESQGTHTYFLMAIAASAIALCVQRTTGKPLQLTMLPLGCAVILWGFSFFAGCMNRRQHVSALLANYHFLQFGGGSQAAPNDADKSVESVKKQAFDNLVRSAKALNAWAVWQFRLLVLGALFFLTWHVIEMARTA